MTRVELATRRTCTLLAKHDPRLPGDRGYLYFPMLSRDRSLLAVAASDGEHDHFRADYDVFAIELDPRHARAATGARCGSPRPAVDRFPDVSRAARRAAAARAAGAAAPAPSAASGWPAAPTPWRWSGRAPNGSIAALRARAATSSSRTGAPVTTGAAGWASAAAPSPSTPRAPARSSTRCVRPTR